MTVNADYYLNSFGGSEQADIDRLLIRAERVIQTLMLKAPETALQNKAYADAVCAQAEYMGLCGGIDGWLATSSGMAQSVSVGSFSISQGQGSSGSALRGISSDAVSILEIAGLLERRCDVW